MDSARLSKVMIRNCQTEKQCLWRRRDGKQKMFKDSGNFWVHELRFLLPVCQNPSFLPNTAIRFDVAGKMIDDKAF